MCLFSVIQCLIQDVISVSLVKFKEIPINSYNMNRAQDFHWNKLHLFYFQPKVVCFLLQEHIFHHSLQ